MDSGSIFNMNGRTRTADTSASEGTLASQAKTFLRWINLVLKRKSLKITNLYDDLEDGVILIRLLECLSSQKMPGRYVHQQ